MKAVAALIVAPAVASSLPLCTAARAGAFMMPEGTGQFIAGIGYSAGSRRFEPSGAMLTVPHFSKVLASGYLEYGLGDQLNFVAAPTMSHGWGSALANSVTGSDGSALGVRLKLVATPTSVLSFQVLLQPPVGTENLTAALSDGGARQFAADLRLAYGQSFVLFGWPAFVDIEPGARLRVLPFPDEARLDLTFGARPWPCVLLLLQAFSVVAPPAPLVEGTALSKVQASAVYDLSPAWSFQAGMMATVAGRNALREMGPLVAVWRRF